MAPLHRHNSPYRPSPSAHLPARLGIAIALALIGTALLLLLQVLLPWLLVGVGALVGLGLWYRHSKRQRLLYSIFYDQLRHHQGRLSVLEFAMAAQIPGPQARRFLDARAQDFFAQFEPTDHGDVIYTFARPQGW
jgi:hypothetical protein